MPPPSRDGRTGRTRGWARRSHFAEFTEGEPENGVEIPSLALETELSIRYTGIHLWEVSFNFNREKGIGMIFLACSHLRSVVARGAVGSLQCALARAQDKQGVALQTPKYLLAHGKNKRLKERSDHEHAFAQPCN